GLHIAAVGIAAHAGAVDRKIVHAPISPALDERLHARRELIAGAQLAKIAVEVAVGVARGRAVGEGRLLIGSAVEAPLERDLDAIEPLTETGAPTKRGVDRQPCKSSLDVGAARIVSANDAAPFEINTRERCHVDAAVDPRIEARPVEV